MRREALWLAAVLLLAGLLRLVALGDDSLSVDEGVSWYFASRPPDQIPEALLRSGEVHPPGYFWLLQLWLAVGSSEAWLRLSSALLGGAGVLLTLWLGAELGGGRPGRSAGFAGVLVAASAFHIHYSRELRMYPLLGALVLLALACYLRWARRGGWGWLGGYAAGCAAGLWVHYYAGFTPLLAALWTAARGSRRLWAGWAAGSAVAVGCFLPWAPRLLEQAGAQDLSLRGPPGGLAPAQLLGRMQFGDLLDETARVYAFAAVVPVLLGLHGWRRARGGVLLGWLLGPPLLVWGVSQFTPLRVFEFKYFVWCVPFLALLEGAALDRMRGGAVLLAGLVALNLVAWGILVFDPAARNQAWREVAAEILRGAPEGTLILVHPNMMQAPLLYYGVPGGRLTPVDRIPSRAMARLVWSHHRVWLVTTPHHPLVVRLGLEPFLDALLVREGAREYARRLPASTVRVVRYRVPNRPRAPQDRPEETAPEGRKSRRASHHGKRSRGLRAEGSSASSGAGFGSRSGGLRNA